MPDLSPELRERVRIRNQVAIEGINRGSDGNEGNIHAPEAVGVGVKESLDANKIRRRGVDEVLGDSVNGDGARFVRHADANGISCGQRLGVGADCRSRQPFQILAAHRDFHSGR